MKKMSPLTRNFILDNIKVNVTVSSYPLRTVTPTKSKAAVHVSKRDTVSSTPDTNVI